MTKLPATHGLLNRLPSLITLALAVLTSVVNAAALKEFSAGTPILAEEMNDNFRLLMEGISENARNIGKDYVTINCDEQPFTGIPGRRPATVVISGTCSADSLVLFEPGDFEIYGNPDDGIDILELNWLYAARGTRLRLHNIELRTQRVTAHNNSTLAWDIECTGCIARWGVGVGGIDWEGGSVSLNEVTLYPLDTEFSSFNIEGATAQLRGVGSEGVGFSFRGSSINIEPSGLPFNGRIDVRGSTISLVCGGAEYCDGMAAEIWGSSAWIEGTPKQQLLLVSSSARVQMDGGSARALDVIGEFTNTQSSETASVSTENSRIRNEGGGINFSNEGSGGSLVNGVPIQ